jgi:hypothetical protein
MENKYYSMLHSSVWIKDPSILTFEFKTIPSKSITRFDLISKIKTIKENDNEIK